MSARRWLSYVLCFSFLMTQDGIAQMPQQIVTDGKTQTAITTSGNVSGVTTGTIRGNNGFNSFLRFNVYRDNTVNLILPAGTENLLNLVNGERSTIDGVLNSIKNGQIGGNIFFINPYGVVFGTTGVVNVGSLVVMTPTKQFLEAFFNAPGDPSEAAIASVFDGTVPLSSDGLIVVRGKINAAGEIKLAAADIANAGVISSGAAFLVTKPDFSDVVNVRGLESGTHLTYTNGNIEIVATHDFENTGAITAEGWNDVNGGSVSIRAGNDIRLLGQSQISTSGIGRNSNADDITILAGGNALFTDDALLAAKGGDGSGNAGSIELSANKALTVSGGKFAATAKNGSAGQIILDPSDDLVVAYDIYSGGASITLSGSNSVTVGCSTANCNNNWSVVTLSTQALDANGFSTGNSGDLTIKGPHITVLDDARLLAGANNAPGTTYLGGDVSLTATQDFEDVFRPGIGAIFNLQQANAGIDIKAATITGKNITISAEATTKKTATLEPQDNPDPADPTKNLPTTIPQELEFSVSESTLGLPPILGKAAAAIAKPSATVNIGSAQINASGEVSVTANATAAATITAAGVYLAYGQSEATASVQVGNGAQVTAGGALTVSAETNNTLNVTAEPITYLTMLFAGQEREQTGPTISVAYGRGRSTSTTTVDAGASLTGGTISVTSENTNEFSTATKSRAYANPSAGVGAAVSIGDYGSNSSATVNGSAVTTQAPTSATDTSGTLTISATSNNTTETVAEATVKENKAPDNDGPSAKENDTKIGEKIDAKKTDTRAGDSKQMFSAAAAVTVMNSVNEAHALIGAGASLASAGDLKLTSTATESIKLRARGESSEAQLSVGGAVLVGDYTNTADAIIGPGAIVDAARKLETSAAAHVTNPTVDGYMDIALGDGWDTKRLLELGKDAVTEFVDRITESGEEDLKGQFWDAIEQATWGPFLTTSVGSRGSAGSSGDSLGIGGSAEFLAIHNTATAAIQDGAKVNLDAKYANAAQTVAVNASGNVRTGNSIGVETEVEHQSSGGSGGTSVGLGGSYSDVHYDNTVTASIGDRAEVHAGTVDVKAESSNLFVNWGSAGSDGNTIGIEGIFTKFTLDNKTDAHIEEGAKVVASGAPVAGTSNVTVKAVSGNYGLLGAGVDNKTGTFGLGASVAVNDITDTTTAYIGNSAGALTAGGVVEGDDVTVDASSTSRLFSVAYAYGASKSDSSSTKEDAKQKGNGKGYGFGISGNVTLNSITQTVDAHISDADVDASNNLKVTADTDSLLAGVAGTLMMSSSGGLTGAYAENTPTRTTKAYIERSTIDAQTAKIGADSSDFFFAITLGGALQGKYFNIAGSVNNNTSTTTTQSWVGDNTVLNSDGTVAVDASNKDFIVSVAGALTTSGKLGVGAGVDIEKIDNHVDASINDADVTAQGNVQVTSSDQQDIYSFAAAVSALANVNLSGAAVTWDIDTDTESTIGKGATVTTPENLLVTSSGDLWLFEVAGQIAGGTKVGIGGSGVVNTIDVTSKATVAGCTVADDGCVGIPASISAGGGGTPVTGANSGVLLAASNKETLKSFAAGAAGGGNVGVAGSAVVNVLTDITEASVGHGAKVNKDTSQADANQSVALRASDDTNILSFAGGAAGGGTAGIGAGADVGIITKTTQATISDDAIVHALNDISVQALSAERATSIAAVLEGGGTVGLAGSASVYKITDATAVYIGAATLDAGDSVLLAAEDETHLLLLDGNLGGAGSVSVGASGNVTDINKSTTATTGAATITARGNGAPGETAGVTANTGLFDITYASYGSSGVGEFPSPDAKTSGVLNDPVLTGHRVATPQQQTVAGLAVSATSITDLLTLAAGGQGSGTLAAAISGAVNIMNDTTAAAIGADAHVNPQNTGASTDQSVLVAAGSDYAHFGITGAVAVAGAGAAAPGADLSLVTLRTTSSIGAGADVTVLKDVTVRSNTQEDLFSMSGTLAGSGAFSLAGSVSSINLNNTTTAFVDKGAIVQAGGNLDVLANDSTDTDILAGSGSLGLGIGGIGGSVSVTIVNKDTQSYLEASAQTDASGKTTVEATSDETVEALTAAGGGGAFVGISGAVSVELLNSDTRAAINGGAKVNQNDTQTGQNVEVSATNIANVNTFGGTAAGSLGASIAGSVDVGSITNDTSATIGDSALVSAAGDISINAAETRTINSTGVGAAGGLVGIAASVSVWGVSSQLATQSLQSGTYQGSGKQDSSYSDAQGYADDQLSGNTTSALTTMLGGADPNSDGGQYMKDAGGTVSAKTSGTPVRSGLADVTTTGTAAEVDGATLHAGGNVSVSAGDTTNLTMLTGTAAGGLVGLGGSVDVATIAVTSEASLSGDVTADGNVSVGATRNETLGAGAYAGQAGLVGLGAAYADIADTSTTSSSLGGNLKQAGLATVSATTTRTLTSTAGNAAIGLGAVGAAIARSTAGGATTASVADSAAVGQNDAVQSLRVSGTDSTTAIADATAVSGGIDAGEGSVAEAKADGTAAAFIGKDAQVDVTNDVTIEATATETATAGAHGLTAGGVTVGVSQADASSTPPAGMSTASASIGESADVHAGGNLSVSSRYNPTGGGVTASASTSAGTLIGLGNGSVANASSSPVVATLISKDAIVSADLELALSSTSNSNANASANGFTAGLATLNGYTLATALVKNSNTVTVDGAAITAGENIRLTADTNETANTPTITGSGYGGVTDNETVGSAWISGLTAANVAGTLNAGGDVSIKATVAEEAHTNPTGAARSVLASGAFVKAFAGGAPQANGTPSNTPVDTPFVTVAPNTSIVADSLTADAHITKLLFEATADSRSFAVGKADPTAEARVVVIASPQVTVGTGAEIVAPDSITLSAVLDSDPDLIHTTSYAFSKIEATSVVGTITSIAQNDTTFDPAVDVQQGSMLHTSNLTVEAHGPIQPEDNTKTFYTRKAETSGTSIVNWVLTKVQSVVTAIFGWIPFVRKIIKWIFKWVAQILDSDTHRIELGNYAVDPAIHMNGVLYQGAASGLNPYLRVGADGTITATGLTAVLDAVGQLIVSDILSTVKSSVTLSAPGGTVDGSFDIHNDTSFDTVDIINDSAHNVVLNNITPVSRNNEEPAISVDADDVSGLQYRFITTQNPTAITITNHSAADIIFQGAISNGSGSLEIVNTNGSIVGRAGNLLQAHDVSINADHGAIGTAVTPLNISLLNGGGSMQYQVTGAPTLSVVAGRDLFANVTADQYLSEAPADPSAYQVAADINSVFVGGQVNLNLVGRALVPQSDATTLVVQPVTVAGVFNLNGAFAAGGDISFVTAPATQINVNATLASGFPDLALQIGADGSVDSPTMNWPASIDAHSVNVGSLQQSGGHIAISGGAVLGGSGTIQVLDGYSHVAVANDSPSNLIIGDVDLSSRINGSITVNGSPVGLNGSIGSVTVATAGYATGEVSIQNSSASDITLQGNIANPSGLTQITDALGSILSGGSAQLVTSDSMALTADQGSIGTVAAPISLSLTGGQLDAEALAGISLTAVNSDLRVGTITSATGDIVIDADGDALLGLLAASAGEIALRAGGAILNGDARFGDNIEAVNISLLARQGGIGYGSVPMNVNTSPGGAVLASAAGDVNLAAVAGALTVLSATSTAGAVSLSSAHGDLNATQLSAAGPVSLDAASSINAAAINSGAELLVNARDGDLDVGTANAVGNVDMRSTGSLNVQQVASSAGAISLNATSGSTKIGQGNAAGNIAASAGTSVYLQQLTSVAGDIEVAAHAGDILFGSITGAGDVSLHASGSVLHDGSAAALSSPRGLPVSDPADIIATNITVFARGGSIGTQLLPLRIDTAPTGVLNASAAQDVYIAEVSGPLTAEAVVSAGGNVTLATESGLLHAVGVSAAKDITLSSSAALIANDVRSASGDVHLTSGADTEVATVTASAGDITVISGGSLLVAAGTTEPHLSGIDLWLTANGAVGASGAPLVTAAAGTTQISAAGDVYFHQVKGSMIASTTTSDGSIYAVVEDPVQIQQLAATNDINLVVNDDLLDVEEVNSPGDLHLSVTNSGGVLTIGELMVGNSMILSADTISVLKLIHTSATPLFIDLFTTYGGPNLRPVDSGVAAAGAAEAADQRRVRDKLDPTNKPEPASSTVTDKTVISLLGGHHE